jgi:AcrR family transcriptional regulator
MGRPTAAATAEATPERLLQAAEAIFAAVGYGTAKLADIAGRAGIRRPSLLYHFRSKEQLYAATVERAFARLRAVLQSTMQAEGEFADRLMSTVERYCEFIGDEPELSRLVLRELLDEHGPGREILVRQIVPLLDVVERWVRAESETADEVPVRQAILMLASDVFLRSAVGRLRETLWGPEDRAKDLARMLLLSLPPTPGAAEKGTGR